MGGDEGTRTPDPHTASAVLVKLPLMRRPMRPALSTMAAAALPLLLLGAGAGLLWLATASFLAGVTVEFFTVVWQTVNATHIPERLLSRVGAHDELWSTVSMPAGQLSAPVLATGPVALAGAAVAATAMLSAALLPVFHRIEIDDEDTDDT